MPCNISSVTSDFVNQYMNVYDLKKLLTANELDSLYTNASQLKWNSGIPGGFITNTPQRLVNAFGDGSGYDKDNASIGASWNCGAWTAAVHQSDVTLLTKVEPLPDWLQKIGLLCRELAKTHFQITTTAHTFNIAVCNKYSNVSHDIKAHTDDNEWYTTENSNVGPMFASLTLYPSTKPTKQEEYARFQILVDEKWTDVKLEDASILLMPSCIPHRVCSAHRKNSFHPRINITLRSVPSIESDAYNSLRGVSNHARYYRIPHRLLLAQDKQETEHVQKLKVAFGSFGVSVKRRKKTKSQMLQKRRELVQYLKDKKLLTGKVMANVVTDLLKAVVHQVQNLAALELGV